MTISAALNPDGFPARIIAALRAGRFQLVMCEPMLAALAKILARPRIVQRLDRIGFTARDRETFVSNLRDLAVMVSVTGEVKLCRDPEDNAIIETALKGDVDALVSRDEDLTRDWEVIVPLQRAGIRVLTVAHFLEALETETEPEA